MDAAFSLQRDMGRRLGAVQVNYYCLYYYFYPPPSPPSSLVVVVVLLLLLLSFDYMGGELSL